MAATSSPHDLDAPGQRGLSPFSLPPAEEKLRSADVASPIFSEDDETLAAASPDTLSAPAEFSFADPFEIPCPSLWRHPFLCTAWIVSRLFSLASLVVMLAVLAAIPIVNLLALGYLLEAEGRVARTGRLRDAFPLLSVAPRLGGLVAGVWIWLFGVRLVADAARDAELIAPGSPIAQGWNIALNGVCVMVTIHLLLALAHGGSLTSFFRPLRNLLWISRQLAAGTYWSTTTQAIQQFLNALRLPHHFWLGTVGFLGTFAWLVIPTALFAALRDATKPGQVLVTLLGGLILIPILAWVPFLQARFAVEQRWSAFTELRATRRLIGQAPVCWFFTTVLLYGLALPLSLFKIAAPPRDALWFVTLIFIATIYPARILVGWAFAQAARRDQPAWKLVAWPCRLTLIPLLAAYLFLLFLTPAIGAAGRRVLFEHHALLLPTPF